MNQVLEHLLMLLVIHREIRQGAAEALDLRDDTLVLGQALAGSYAVSVMGNSHSARAPIVDFAASRPSWPWL